MLKKEKQYPSCFGILEKVFPKGEDGFRNSPSACTTCFCKTECLKSAMEGIGGLKIQEEHIDRAYSVGMIGFWERWSKKKDLNRKIKEKIKG